MRMNDRIVLHTLLEGYVGSQRELAQETELSLGAVNNAIKALVSEGYIDAYFQNNCTPEDRLLVYCYISLWGLYCSFWCEYKAFLGENYSEFNMSSYYYAKTYYKIFEEEYNKLYGKEYSV